MGLHNVGVSGGPEDLRLRVRRSEELNEGFKELLLPACLGEGLLVGLGSLELFGVRGVLRLVVGGGLSRAFVR